MRCAIAGTALLIVGRLFPLELLYGSVSKKTFLNRLCTILYMIYIQHTCVSVHV